MKASLYSTARACARALSPVGRGFLGGAVFLYGWYLKGSISLQKRGITVHHPLYALVSRHHIHHAMIVGISLLAIGHTALLGRVDEQEFLLPQNTLSRLFAEEDAFIVETQNFTPLTDSEYVTSTDIRSQPTLAPTEGTPKQSPLPDAGSLASIPDTLIKPVLPTIQAEPYQSQTIQTYVVKTGDTLGSIARAHGLKLSTLLWANNLTERSLIRLGQHLVVLPVDGIHYRIKRGDTLGVVAKRFSSDVDSIIKTNSLANPNAVAIGDLLIIPGGIMPAAPRSQLQRSLIGRVRDTYAPSGTSERSSGSYIWPTSARRITQYFSWRHIGVDIAGPPSNRIYAAADGVVSFAGWARGYGLSLVINHGGGKQTRYGHSRKLFVKVGQSVSQGETIAMVGSTGRSTGPHLHFEVIVNGKRVNPFAYIR